MTLPTLWIHGADDQLVPYDVTAATMERIKGTSLRHTAYDGAAHEVFNETNKRRGARRGGGLPHARCSASTDRSIPFER